MCPASEVHRPEANSMEAWQCILQQLARAAHSIIVMYLFNTFSATELHSKEGDLSWQVNQKTQKSERTVTGGEPYNSVREPIQAFRASHISRCTP